MHRLVMSLLLSVVQIKHFCVMTFSYTMFLSCGMHRLNDVAQYEQEDDDGGTGVCRLGWRSGGGGGFGECLASYR